MSNLPLFYQGDFAAKQVGTDGDPADLFETIHLPDGELRYCPDWLLEREASALLETIVTEVCWEQSCIWIGGRERLIPRLNAWYGDAGAHYTYSGMSLKLNCWTKSLAGLKQRVERASGKNFNSALLNCYRSGQDSVDWHSDDEKELGSNPVIASLSLGLERRFDLRHKTRNNLRFNMDLAHGSLLVMGGAMQHHWQHRIAKQRHRKGLRVNITFRQIQKQPASLGEK